VDRKNPGDHLGERAMKLVAIYIKDSKRYHVFQLEEGQGVTGSLYFPRDGDKIPDEVTIILKTPGEDRGRQQDR